MHRKIIPFYFLLALYAFALAPGGWSATPISLAFAADETPQDVVAIQIRRQGYKCDKALGAERDRAASRPNAPLWVLRCDNATYRVRLHPEMAAEVERIK